MVIMIKTADTVTYFGYIPSLIFNFVSISSYLVRNRDKTVEITLTTNYKIVILTPIIHLPPYF